jgi:hypothetical protein
MKLIIEFFLDKSILSALLIILSLESMMQLGCYRPFLKKNSYASTVNHISDTSISSLKTLKPNTLIIGTSIAYEGVSLEILNEEMKSKKVVVQSIAIPGSELIVQDLALQKIFSQENSIQTIIHINDLQMPWIDREKLLDATLAMVTEFDRSKVLQRIKLDKYTTTWKDYSFLFSRFVAYKKDIGDFILKPDKRLKDIQKELRKKELFFYSYDNKYEESLSLYKINSLQDCINKTKPGSTIPEGSNAYHMDAIYRTCTLALGKELTSEKNKFTELYKLRLNNLYETIHSKNLRIIHIYPPVPLMMENQKYSQRIDFWEKEYADILSEIRINLSDTIPEQNNSDYYYDMVHLNRKGKELFTKKLAQKLLELQVSN